MTAQGQGSDRVPQRPSSSSHFSFFLSLSIFKLTKLHALLGILSFIFVSFPLLTRLHLPHTAQLNTCIDLLAMEKQCLLHEETASSLLALVTSQGANVITACC